MKIKLKKLDRTLTIPKQAHDGDAGYDLISAIDATIRPGERLLVPTGIALQIPSGYGGFVQPRSGLAIKQGIGLVNSPGLIDSSYRGEIKVIMINLDKKKEFSIKRGDKIAQLVVQKVIEFQFEEVDELDDSDRGAGGFGSSGR